MDFLNILNNVWPYAVAIVCFLLLILIHEGGHFIAAKLLGVQVNEFSIGFGPKLIKKQIGDTLYSVSLLPFGGFCSMEGEDETSQNPRAFCNKKPWRRLIITAMGAMFNLIFGLILIVILLIPGELFTSTTVANFSENATSRNYGLQENDQIIGVDGRYIFSSYDLSYAFTNIDDGKIDITVKRDGERVLLKDVEFESEEYEGITYLSVDFSVYGEEKTILNFAKYTVKTACAYCAVIYRSLFDLLAGKYGISAVSGPVGITRVMGNAAKQDLLNLLPIMALITINLGLFNLLPIPALDGGRIVFIMLEMLLRRPVAKKYEPYVHGIGFAVLIIFMILICIKDIISLFV